MNKLILLPLFALSAAQLVTADPGVPTVGSIWGHPDGTSVSTAGQASLYSDAVAHGVGDLITIVVDLQNQVTKQQNTTTAKTAAVNAVLTSLLYPNDNSNHGFNFLNYHGSPPTVAWSDNQAFKGGGTIANQETASTTIQARVVAILPNRVLQVEAHRLSKAGAEDTAMILTGLVRPEDLSSVNTISSSQVADLQIVQKGKGTITEDQRKGWLTRLYEFLSPF